MSLAKNVLTLSSPVEHILHVGIIVGALSFKLSTSILQFYIEDSGLQ